MSSMMRPIVFFPGSHPTASSSPPLHWHQPHPFSQPPLGAGVDAELQAVVASCLERLSHDPEVAALVLYSFGEA
jgi:hypothetical protein